MKPVWIRSCYEINISNVVEPNIHGIVTVKLLTRWPSWKPSLWFHICRKKCYPETFQRNPSKYWQAIKPFMIDKSKAVEQNISLLHDNKVVNGPVKVCNIFNDSLIEAASHIGKEDPIQDNETIDDILCSHEDHTTIKRIISNDPHASIFSFSFICVNEV